MVPRRLVFVLIYLFFLHSPPVSAQTTDALDCPLAVSVNPRDAVPHSELRDSLARAHPIATGAGVRVAVVDTGVAPHPRLPTLIPGGDLVGAHMAEGIPGEFLDCDGHGTIVAGIIAARAKQGSGWPYDGSGDEHSGVAPAAEVIAIKQTTSYIRDHPDSGVGTLGSLAESIHRAIDLGAKVINVSVVSCIPPERATSISGTAIEDALLRAEDSGVVVIAAAGNLSESCPAESVVYPAHAPTVVAVSASSDSHTIADYSISPPTQLVSAPGKVPAGLSPRDPGFSSAMDSSAGTRPFEGTSFASPVVAGTAALLIERYPLLSPQEIRERIIESVDPAIGSVDPYLALTYLPASEEPESHPVAVVTPADPDSSEQRRSLLLLSAVVGISAFVACIGGWLDTHRHPVRRGVSPRVMSPDTAYRR